MRRSERRALEASLRSHFHHVDESLATDEPMGSRERLVAALAAQAARPAWPGWPYVAAVQVRYMGAMCWALHLVVVLAAFAAAGAGVSYGLLAGALAAVLALASLSEATRSRSCSMAELEASCAVNAQSVACARLVVLGCIDALLIVVVSGLVASGYSLWLMAAQIGAPYLLAVASGLAVARRVSSSDATAGAMASAALVFAACLGLYLVLPEAFGATSGAIWLGAAASAGVFACIEGRRWLRAAAGISASPQVLLDVN